jgi:Spy/CpxP family protein refolding chaperone
MTKLVVIVGFVISFAAGLMVGMQSRPASVAAPTTRPVRRGGGWLTSELTLTAQQQEAMNKIWSDTARSGRGEQDDRRRQLRHDRDEAIAALVRPEDKEKYDQAIKNFSEQMATIDREMRARFDEAVKKTKEILTPEQRTKYDEILARHQVDRARGGDRGPDHGGERGGRDREPTTRQGDAGATSRPLSQP